MPSFSDSIFLFVLALLLFGPKRLPALARELGKWVGEFRRASNEFKMQMDEELRLSEQSDRNKQIAAMEAAAPITPALPEPEHPHMPSDSSATGKIEAIAEIPAAETAAEPDPAMAAYIATEDSRSAQPDLTHTETTAAPAYEVVDGVRQPLPIATSGEMKIMPPATGLPTPRNSALKGLLDSIPPAAENIEAANTTETAAHGN